MKKRYSFISFLALVLCITLISSCSNSEKENGFGNVFKDKRVTEIINIYDTDKVRVEKFTYSNNKLVRNFAEYKGEYANIENNQEVIYNKNEAIFKGLLDNYECQQIYTLGQNGYATSCHTIYAEEEFSTTFKYSKEGYLVEAVIEEEDTYRITFSYSNGNINKIIREWIGGDTGKDTYNLSYTDIENKGGVMCPFLVYDILWEHTGAYYAGLLGKPTKNLLESIMYEDRFYQVPSFNYILDDEGYIKTAQNSDNLFSFIF